MKTFIHVILAFALILVGVQASNAQAVPALYGAAQADYNLTVAGTPLAVDTAISGTKYSKTFVMFQRGASERAGVNYLSVAKAVVFTRQTNDSIKALVYVQAGQITSGTEGKTYGTYLVDSVSSTSKALVIDLAKYATMPEIRLKVVAGTGNGYLPYWSAYFGGQGILVKETKGPKAPQVR